MGRYQLWCSPSIANKFKTYPAREVAIKGLEYPFYEVPNNCIAIHLKNSVLIWPLIDKAKQTKDTKNG